ncbi:hypothetical protein AVEN_181065-1 [Araneus ventricosus]|uniref:Uncharacterized protein n=1 Tax=Araneus ventricosus TaxID=182803 RepID=A0A4Y2WP59_ARAVE|nr:hypothetical protein AVEN_250778-1 [Araneus ventricosus]GBO38220.1 hypothetical protein AVEN_49902-1 [Araneus ventricosus]GBO38225.1 hypothetical protein AVEN_157700-1 [Araneus ventricosus]GBO38230.1 hypothetical protein AVEN_181065-1 [Araneus ventricosus]
MIRTIPKLPPNLQDTTLHQREDSLPERSYLRCTRHLQWNWVSNLEDFEPEGEALPLGEHLLHNKQPPAKFQVSSRSGLGDSVMNHINKITIKYITNAKLKSRCGLVDKVSVSGSRVQGSKPTGVVPKVGAGASSSSDSSSKLRGQSQNSAHVASKRDITLTKLIQIVQRF